MEQQLVNEPWPWYIAGPLIGLVVPALLLLGNKTFGISSSLRHLCAACLPIKGVSFFNYEWRKESWNLLFVLGIMLGALAFGFGDMAAPISVDESLQADLQKYGVSTAGGLAPADIFNLSSLFTLRGFIMMVGGGFLVGFGTRYAGGCTSGHSIMGMANLQWPSLVATICFMLGGIAMTHLILPFILAL